MLRTGGSSQTVFVVDPNSGKTRQYGVKPRQLFTGGAALVVGCIATTLLILVFTPVRTILPGPETSGDSHLARLTELRISALEDSLLAQQAYMRQLRFLLTGEFDPDAYDDMFAAVPQEGADIDEDLKSETSRDWADHLQPALPLTRMPVSFDPETELASSAPGGYLSALRLPVEPPVEGFATRHFDARRGHFGIDIAASEGSIVRSVGDGYVIMADWTHDGGWIIALQHAAGYVSIYKHNQRLLKQVGDRVREREAIAVSGDSGVLTSGPHLHFELWHDGLAQDPRQFIVGY